MPAKTNCNFNHAKVFFVPQKPIFKLLACFLGGVLWVLQMQAQQTYRLHIKYLDSGYSVQSFTLQQTFSDKESCLEYIYRLPALLQTQGFVTASVDSVAIDTAQATIHLFFGKRYQWKTFNVKQIDHTLLSSVGFRERQFREQPLNMQTVQQLQGRLLQTLENNGYPFAKIWLDSFVITGDSVTAALMLEKGPLYKIDSIRVYGDVKINNKFLQRYLEISAGSPYRQNQLSQVSPRLLQLPYLQEEAPWNLSLLGTGSILNLYLKPRRSSQVSGLVGFLPANEQLGGNRMLVTGDFNLHLRNSLGMGEALWVMWQQIQVQSPRLQIRYEQPFLGGSAFGTDINFELFKKDSSFLNLNFRVGVQYAFGGNRNGKVFFHSFGTNLITVDTLLIRNTRRLPEQIDQRTSGLGIDYEWFNTDYRFNPRKGNEFRFTGMGGIRRIRPNNNITSISDPLNPGKDLRTLYDSVAARTYTLRMQMQAARYFRLGKQATFKTALQAGWIESPFLFRNELYQIGGFKTLRGFDEESIFASRYGILTTEWRLLTGLNSYLFAFVDAAWVANRSIMQQFDHRFLGAGLGVSFENKAGVFNLAFAVGKRDDLPLNLRQAKIHFGFVNFF